MPETNLNYLKLKTTEHETNVDITLELLAEVAQLKAEFLTLLKGGLTFPTTEELWTSHQKKLGELLSRIEEIEKKLDGKNLINKK